MIRSCALSFAAVLAVLALFAGCSRSSLQGELGTGVGSPCSSNADCPAGTSCDLSLGQCVVDDAGSDASCSTNINSDPNNCGACGNVCPPADPFCVNGQCEPPSQTCSTTGCSFSQTCCPEGCTDTLNDSANCGGCGVVCPNEGACEDGMCIGTPPPCGPCAEGDVCCGASCTNTTNDLNNCGGCGLVCPPGTAQCVDGQCCTQQTCTPPQCSCAPDQTCCLPTGCVSTDDDPQNCGGCGIVCPSGICQNFNCTTTTTCAGGPACGVGQSCCANGCTSTTSDPLNCGACGNVCPDGQCVSSMCTTTMTCAGGPACTGGESCCASGCSNVLSDPSNCGACGVACPPGESCVAGACQSGCDGGTCAAGQTCCAAGCANTQTDPQNCGGCNIQCGTTASCVDGSCVANEGAFDPIVNPTYLPPGVHSYTTINVPAGVTVYVGGAGALSGTLDLHATGTIEIDGTIDVSGGPGTQNTITSQNTESGRAGGGGFTGEPYQTAALSAACQFVAGNPGSLGFAVSGSVGTCAVGSSTVCDTMGSATSLLFAAPPGEYGGGAGVFTGYRAYGSGGGGPAGGAPGALGAAYPGESDCSGASGGGGAENGAGGVGGGPPYDGTPGVLGQTQCPGISSDIPAAYVGGGGGGSIGETAASDLAVTTTFQTGSAGGGGSADYLNRPVFGGTSGGGGAGGALRLATPASITVTGQLFANGGIGADSVIGTPAPDCNPQPGAAGGGGSGGVIYLSAPTISVTSAATISAAGGAGGAQSEFATGGAGGAGGLGRLRISVTPGTCSITGALTPALAAGCTATPGGTTGAAYVGVYPN